MFDPSKYEVPDKAILAHNDYLREVSKTINEGQRAGDYTVGRPLGDRSEAFKYFDKPETYHQALPTHEDRTFEEELEKVLQIKGEATLCDLGFGAGLALKQLSEKEPFKMYLAKGLLRIIGSGNPHFAQHDFSDPSQGSVIHPPIHNDLIEKGIKVDDRDILETLWEMDSESVDVFVSVVTMNWINYPKGEILKHINRILTANGCAYLSDIRLEVPEGDDYSFRTNYSIRAPDYLTAHDVNIEQSYRGISFKKSKNMELMRSWKFGDGLVAVHNIAGEQHVQ